MKKENQKNLQRSCSHQYYYDVYSNVIVKQVTQNANPQCSIILQTYSQILDPVWIFHESNNLFCKNGYVKMTLIAKLPDSNGTLIQSLKL